MGRRILTAQKREVNFFLLFDTKEDLLKMPSRGGKKKEVQYYRERTLGFC
jgi:hypothetical protein